MNDKEDRNQAPAILPWKVGDRLKYLPFVNGIHIHDKVGTVIEVAKEGDHTDGRPVMGGAVLILWDDGSKTRLWQHPNNFIGE